MAIQYVGGNTATKAGATSGNSTISLTALTGGISSSAAAGDIVIAVFATGSAADRTLSITDGTTAYTLIGTELYSNGTTYDTNLRVAYKVLTAADATVTFGPTLNAQDAGAMALHVWRGVDSTTPLDVAATTATGTGSGRPNPPAITPVTAGSEIIVAGGAAAGTGAVFVGTGLSNFRTATSVDTNDAMVGIGSFDWVSGTYDPAAWTGGTANAADSWASITLALRPSVTQTLTPNLYTNEQTFFSPEVTQTGAAQTLTASLYTNDQTFFAPSVDASNTIAPDLYVNDQTFFAATVETNNVLEPAIYENTQTFYNADVTQGGAAQSLIVDRYDNTNAFYSATVSTGTVNLSPDRYDNTNTFYEAVVSAGAVNLTPSLYENTNQFYSPVVQADETVIAPNLYVNTNDFYSASIATSNQLQANLYENTNSFYSQQLTNVNYVSVDLYQNTNVFYSPTVSQGAQIIAPGLLVDDQLFYPAQAAATYALVAQGYAVDGYVDEGYYGPNTFSVQEFYSAVVQASNAVVAPYFVNQNTFFTAQVALDSYVLTKAQALQLYNVYLLQGLQNPLIVGPSSRVAGPINQTITQDGSQVTIATTTSATSFGGDVGTLIAELAALHGIGSNLIVTDSSRSSGPVVQSLASVGGITTVTRQ